MDQPERAGGRTEIETVWVIQQVNQMECMSRACIYDGIEVFNMKDR